MYVKRSFKKIISLVICFILVLPTSAFAQQITNDYSDHWAGKQITSFLEKGFVNVYKDGSFRPNNPVTRAEFAVVANKVFGLTLVDKVNFKDVKLKDAFYKDMAIARKAGYFTPLPGGVIKPSTNMSRQEFAVVLARLLKIDTKKEILNKVIFKDNDKIAVWSRNSIDAIVQRGYMSGNTDGTFNPAGMITRAQAVAVLEICLRDNIITAYGNLKVAYKKPGTYIAKIINGNAAIEVPNVTLQDTIINGNLIIGEGVGNGNIRLKNVTVTGNTVIRGGGLSTIVIENSKFARIVVFKADSQVRVLSTGTTVVDKVDMLSGGRLEEQGTTGNGFGLVTLAERVNPNESVSLKGNFESVQVQADKVKLDIGTGSVGKIDVANSAANSSINIATAVKVGNLTAAAPVTISGAGKIESATVSTGNAVFAVIGNPEIGRLNVTGENAQVSLGTGVKVVQLIVEAKAVISGAGTIGTAEIKVQNVVLGVPTTTVKTPEGITATATGTTITTTNTVAVPTPTPAPVPKPTPAPKPRSGGGGGGGGGGGSSTPSIVPVSAINNISGTAKVGVELTAGTLTPTWATVSYQWKICDTVGGIYTNIAGATTNKYTPVASDATKFIKVSATGTGSYSGTVTSAATAAVAAATPITGTAIAGVTAPVAGATPVTTATATAEYTAAVTWSPVAVTFGASTVYTATITLTPKAGYTLTGVTANQFTVAGATATNVINSGVVTAVFPATAAAIAAPALANGLSFADDNANDTDTVITLGSPSVGLNTFVYKISVDANAVPTPNVGDDLSAWTAVANGASITAANGKHIGVAEVNGNLAVQFSDATAVTEVEPAPVIATVSTIANAAVDPTVTVTGTNFNAAITSSDLTVGVGATSLTLGTVTYVSATEITVAFTGTAVAGDITIQATTSAFDPAGVSASNTLTVTIP